VSLRETVRGIDDAARTRRQRTLNRLVAEAEKARRPPSVISLAYAEHAEFKQEIVQLGIRLWLLELGGHDEDPPDDGD
jgi:hypothetical protein